jgi:hypothetical protein
MSDTQRLNTETKEVTPRIIPKDIPNLSVFQFPYTWKSWSGFWGNLIYLFKCFKAMWERGTKGYTGQDTWDVNYSVVGYLIRVLTEYRNSTNGWPDQLFETFDEWITRIDEIIDLLIYSQDDPDKRNIFFERFQEIIQNPRSEWTEEDQQDYDAYVAEANNIHDKQTEARTKAFALLAPILEHIWW